MRYVEFAVTSNFSFLRGASHPEEMLAQAAQFDLAGMGLCDRNSVVGVVRAHVLKRETNLTLRYHPGARLVFADGTPDILAYPRDRPAWGRLCRLLTTGNLRAEKGECILFLDDLLAHIDGLELVVMEKSTFESDKPTRDFLSSLSPAAALCSSPSILPFSPSPLAGDVDAQNAPGGGSSASNEQVFAPTLTLPGKWRREKGSLLSLLRDAAPDRVRLAASMLYRGDDRTRLADLAAHAQAASVP